MKRIFILFTFLTLHLLDYAQNNSSFGRFNGQYFSISDINSSSQIWTGTQDRFSNVFFGNNDGILAFNGIKWKIIECDSSHSGVKKSQAVQKSKVTKIFESKNGKIYVGRNDNFGEIQYSKQGKIVYHPLFIARNKNSLGQVWNIVEHKNVVYFIGEKKILSYNGSKIEEVVFSKLSSYYVETSSKLNEGILFTLNSDDNNSSNKKYIYYHFETKTENEILLPSNYNRLTISGVFEQKGSWNLFNVLGDVYRFKEINKKIVWEKEPITTFSFLKNYKVNSVKIHNDYLYIATENNGMIVSDLNGKIVRVFDLDDKMENLNVFDFFHDEENNLWLCLDNGIHFFETTSPLTYYDKSDGILDVINRFDIVDNKEYVATASGITTTYFEKNHKKFKAIEGFNQEVFDINTYETDFGTKTIAIAGIGIYEFNFKTNKHKLLAEDYAWVTIQNPYNKNEIFVGSETSVGKLTLKANTWNYEIIIPNVEGDVRDLVFHNGKLIYGSENNGVFVYDFVSKKSTKVKTQLNKKLNTSYVLETFKGKVYIGFETGLYELTNDFKKLVPFKGVGNHFIGDNNLQIHRLINFDDKHLWVVIHNEKGSKKFENGWLEFENNQWKWTSWPFEQIALDKDPVIFDIVELNDKEIWFGGGNTIFSFNPQVLSSIKRNFKLSFDEIHLNTDLVIYDPNKAKPLGEIDYAKNTVKFVFHANSFIGLKEMKYRYRLDGYVETWSDWSELNFADFKKIPEGTYTLKVQAKNIYGFESETLSYTFTILPPWYRTWWAYAIYFVSFVFLIYLTIRLSIQRVKNQNIKLEHIVEERTSEIADQNKQLELQKEEIQQKTQDIVDSIIYAKRIQETILPNERLERMFKDYFVFYRPKDIVSGDFYWARQKGDLAIFSAIDCTGHGVPGALVSIVGNASLLRCVNEHSLTEPSEILNKHRDIVVKSFVSKAHTDVKDGMDMSLCVLDNKSLVMKYSGANNECVIIRNGELIELKPDKQPIGQFSHATPFSQQEIQLQVGDCVYQFTDGYVDQFGGDKGKKLKSKPFKEMLLSISHLEMKEQRTRVESFFDEWKGELDQIDDVCVFGVKI